ncbi:MAG: hypothetical protein BZ137_03570, partial [Methanosphaera sp. rholeuAM130]
MNPVEATLVIDEVDDVYINQTASVHVHLQYNGVDVTDTGSITIEIGDYTNSATITDATVRSTFTDYSSETAGTKTVTATYSGTQYYVTSPVTETFEVNKVPTTVTLPVVSTTTGVPVEIKAYVNPTLSGYPPVNSAGTFTFEINGEQTVTVDVVDGVATTTYAATTAGEFTVTGTFAGDDYYLGDDDTNLINVIDDRYVTDIEI